MGAPPPRLSPPQIERAQHLAASMSPAAMTRAMETLGVALVELRQAPDPRVDLEVALVRLCRPDTDRSLDALTARVEALEGRLAGGAGAPPPSAPIAAPAVDPAPPAVPDADVEPVAAAPTPPPAPAVPEPAAPAPAPVADVPAADPPASVADDTSAGPAAAARRALAERRGEAAPSPSPPQPPTVPAAPPPVPGGGPPAPVPPPPASVEPEPAAAVADDEAEPAGPPADGAVVADLRAIQPLSPTEVVQLAGIHLGLDRDLVVRRATEVLGPAAGSRTPDDLARLWNVLVDEVHPPEAAVAPPPAPDPVDPPPFDDGDPGPSPPDDGDQPPADDSGRADDGLGADDALRAGDAVSADDPVPADDDIDVHDLVDAPSHTDAIIEQLTEAFPGAELHINEPSEER